MQRSQGFFHGGSFQATWNWDPSLFDEKNSCKFTWLEIKMAYLYKMTIMKRALRAPWHDDA